ncbi:MAG: protein arginine kinase [Planctomycetes bacterium]|nr:protein arginine kinase [Planctomycetota bacterium]
MKIDNLVNGVGEWLKGDGPESGIVISSRIRLARNLHNFPFLTIADDKQREAIEEFVRTQLESAKLKPVMHYLPLKGMTALDRQVLVERHLISKDLAQSDGTRGLFVDETESLSIMVNEEDHLRIQSLKSGLQLHQGWEEINALDDQLEKALPYAFSAQFGYLTACPTNVGTGMRISVMMHLPALTMIKQVDKVFHAIARIKFMVRGLYGEGSQAAGEFYQVSNQISLGKSEKDIINEIYNIIPEIIKYEQTWRKKLMVDAHKKLEDRIFRALGALRYAQSISSDEAMEMLSAIRMGITMDIIKDIPLQTVNEIFISTQPAHLQKMEKKTLNMAERDIARAAFIRKKLAGTAS